jgi:hypothetical protein
MPAFEPQRSTSDPYGITPMQTTYERLQESRLQESRKAKSQKGVPAMLARPPADGIGPDALTRLQQRRASKGAPAMLARPPADGVPLMLERRQPQQGMSSMQGLGALAPGTMAAEADGTAVDNPQPGTAVAPAVDALQARTQAGKPNVPPEQEDALAGDEGFQRALAKSGAMTIGSKRPGKIGGKAGPTFSSGQFKGMTYDQARESWTSRNQGSNLMPRVNRTPQEVAAGSPVQRQQQRAFNTGAADGLPGQPASPQMDAFMRKLGGSPAAGAQGPTNSPTAARTAESALESRLTRAVGGAAPGGDSIASAQTPAPTNPEKTPGFKSVRAGKN